MEKIEKLTEKVDLTSGLIDELMDPEVQAFLKKCRELKKGVQ